MSSMAGTSSSLDGRSTIGDVGDATFFSTTAILVRSFISTHQRDHGPRCEHAVCSPAGIATIVLSARAKPILDYLKVFEQSANLFPSFETEVQGLYTG
jgi:hypothetical protein